MAHGSSDLGRFMRALNPSVVVPILNLLQLIFTIELAFTSGRHRRFSGDDKHKVRNQHVTGM